MCALNPRARVRTRTNTTTPTQVPQYLLEQAVQDGRGGSTNIIVCQPRRIAAVGLASRVAAELGDPAGVGGLCGYSVRLDTKVSVCVYLVCRGFFGGC